MTKRPSNLSTDADGNELSPEAVAFASRIEQAREEHEESPSEPWSAPLRRPARPAGVPESATLENADKPTARWKQGKQNEHGKHGVWRSWALDGEQVAEAELDNGQTQRLEVFRPGGKLASKWQHDGPEHSVYELYTPEGARSCRIRYRGTDGTALREEDIVLEQVFDAAGSLVRGVERDASKLREFERDGVTSFENLPSEGGRTLRFYEDGKVQLTVFAADDGDSSNAIAHEVSSEPFAIDSSGIDAESTSRAVLRFLPSRLFEATIQNTECPSAVDAFTQAHPWSTEVNTGAPVGHTSVANLMTALVSPTPFVEVFARVGLPNLLNPEAGPEIADRLRATAPVLLDLVVKSDRAEKLGSWLSGVLQGLELPVEGNGHELGLLRLVTDAPITVRLPAIQRLAEEDLNATRPLLGDKDPAIRTVAAAMMLAVSEGEPDADAVATIAEVASGLVPDSLAGEFEELVGRAAIDGAIKGVFAQLLEWYRADPDTKASLEDVMLHLMRMPDGPVPKQEAADFLRTWAKHRQELAAPLAPGLGLPARLVAIAEAVERDGLGEVPEADAEFEIGHVNLPSGNLVVVDMGAMGQWTDDAPHHADISGSSWAGAMGASRGDFFDLRVVGADARQGLAAFVRAEGTAPLFDVNEAQAANAVDRFAAVAAEHSLDAQLERSPQRIGHGARVRLLAESGLEAGGFSFAHVNAVTVHGLPSQDTLPVVGKWTDDETWAYVSLVCRPTAPVSAEQIDTLGVEEARLMFADATALAHWEHERPPSGLTDLVFWGGREHEFADRFGLSESGGHFGWYGLPPEAFPPGWFEAVLEASDSRQLATDIRWHSSHYAILRHAWATELGVGTATIGDAAMCGLFSSVGDGGFPVMLERDADGVICRVTVHIDTDDEEDDTDDGDD